MQAPTVAVVVITYNSAADLPACLDSLRNGGAEGVDLTDVVVVDNASSDASVELAKATTGLPISVVQLLENAGYAAGVNAGVDAVRGRPPEAVMVLNPDCRLLPGALATLARALHVPGRGVVAPRLINPDGTLQPSLRRVPTLRGVVVEAVLGGRVADRLDVGELVFAEEQHARAGVTPWATGAALLMDWQLLESVGPWNEDFLLYSEETEYLLRAGDHGWSTWYEPAAVVEHRGGDSGINPSLAALLTVNRVVLFEQRRGSVAGRMYSAALVLGMAIRAAAGQRTARASLGALLFPSRRITSLAQLG
ncbi:glycosyltransferase [Nocardioides sp. MAH-18]|uniref:Glycosyltransferase n=1 Tax=Nocardioides agri TaxID=2682843 RepID=A0A6L6XTX0_9ACTN|nr:glycosyltransferase family 2 protein [Nocardioides sp. CGMCC 1.13656]MBA2954234.1 glycosyltransferase family 2 protein [Nocardioides sp. CGMCC 1.13656]MVQ49095.1 glycosyltransferase [Nocardioides sp. MAH-18]